MDSLKQIAEDLQINCILQSIDKYIENYEKISQQIDEQQETIDTIDGLFELLYNIKSYGVGKVKASIVGSRWSKREEDVKELAAFILQVVKPSFSLHKEISELIIELSKEADDGNELKILVPFIVDRLMTLYWPRSIERKESELQDQNQLYNRCDTSKPEETINLTNRCVYSFIRILYKRCVISKEGIYFRLKKYDLSNNVLNAFFLPELIDVDPKNINKIEALHRINKRIYKGGFGEFYVNENQVVGGQKGLCYNWRNFVKKYLPDRIDMYERMLENMEPDDELTKSLRHDDVDKFQDIVNRDGLDINKGRVPYNIIDDFEEDISYLNYSAFCGSVKCFKFIILNKGEVDDTTFYFSVCGGNNEIIKIVDQKSSNATVNDNSKSMTVNYDNFRFSNPYIIFWFNFDKNNSNQHMNHTNKYDDDNIQYSRTGIDGDLIYFLNCNNINNIIAPTIEMNQNNLFDWIFENKFVNQGKSGNNLKHIAILSASSGNAHSLIALIDNGFLLTKNIISYAARNGFYKLTKILLELNDKKAKNSSESSDDSFDYQSVVHFGNLSIFKLFIYDMNQSNIEQALLHAIEISCTEIIQYVFDHLNELHFKFDNNDFIRLALKTSIQTNEKMFNFLIEYFKSKDEVNPLLNLELFSDLLIQSCIFSNFAVAKEITDMIQKEDPKYDFTEAFFKASSSKSMDICRLFIDRKVNIDFEKETHISELGHIELDLFKEIIHNFSTDIKTRLYECIHESIHSKNKEVVEFILQDRKPKGKELIEAIRTDDVELVELILKYNSDPTFINQIDDSGPGLCIATEQQNLEIVRCLFKVRGIDANLCNFQNQTPLMIAVASNCLEIVDEILNFYEKEDNPSNLFSIVESIVELEKECSVFRRQVNESTWNIIERFAKFKSIDLNLTPYDKFNGSNQSLLYIACFDNKIEFVRLFLSLPNIDVNIYETYKYYTPLMIALERNNIEIAKLLINHPKTNINLLNYCNESALAIAAKNNQTEIIDLLVNDKRFDPNESILAGVFAFSKIEISQHLCSLNCLDVNEFYLGANALHHAVEINDVDKIDMIINHPSFDIKKSRVNKAIFIAAKENNVNVFGRLISLIENDINLKNDDHESLLSYASKHLSVDIVEFIINNEHFDSENEQIIHSFVDCYSNSKTESDSNQQPILYRANQSNRSNRFHRFHTTPFWETNLTVIDQGIIPDKCTIVEMMEKLFNYDNEHAHLINFEQLLPNGKSFFTAISSDYEGVGVVCDFLIEHGVDPNQPDKHGVYPLEHAIKINSLDLVTSLVNTEKVNYNQLRRGLTYLHLAARNSDSSILAFLLQKNEFDINSVDDRGATPLIQACRSKSIENINLLFQKSNLDYLHCDKNGKDALDVFVSLQPDEKKTIKENKEVFHDTLISILNEMKKIANIH